MGIRSSIRSSTKSLSAIKCRCTADSRRPWGARPCPCRPCRTLPCRLRWHQRCSPAVRRIRTEDVSFRQLVLGCTKTELSGRRTILKQFVSTIRDAGRRIWSCCRRRSPPMPPMPPGMPPMPPMPSTFWLGWLLSDNKWIQRKSKKSRMVVALFRIRISFVREGRHPP